MTYRIFLAPSPRHRTAYACLALLGATACSSSGDASVDGALSPAQSVGIDNIALVQTGRVQSGPLLSGTLAAENEAAVRAQISATVLEVHADVGKRVRRGELLARLDDRSLRDAALSVRSAVRSAETAAQAARRELSRQEQLLAMEAVSERDVENSRTALATAEANLADAQSRLTSAEQELSHTRLTAPIDGVVGSRDVSVGDVIQTGAAMFTIVDPAALRLEASIPADALAGVRVGTPVSFVVRGYPDRTFTGRITRVSPTADPSTRQVDVYATIPNSGDLVTGLFASGRVASETAEGLVATVDAIDARELTPVVMRLRAGVVERISVQLGLRDDVTRLVAISGVAAGDTLLTGAAQALPTGARVSVVRGDTAGTGNGRR